MYDGGKFHGFRETFLRHTLFNVIPAKTGGWIQVRDNKKALTTGQIASSKASDKAAKASKLFAVVVI